MSKTCSVSVPWEFTDANGGDSQVNNVTNSNNDDDDNLR